MIGLLSFMVFNATFNNISVISWRSVPGEHHRSVASCITYFYFNLYGRNTTYNQEMFYEFNFLDCAIYQIKKRPA